MMNSKDKNDYTTFSMILCQLIMGKCKDNDVPLTSLYQKSGVSQATWSRIMRGQTKLGVEDLKNACQVAGTDMPSVIRDAEKIAAELPKEHVEVSEPVGTAKKDNDAVKIVLASAALAFLISRLLK